MKLTEFTAELHKSIIDFELWWEQGMERNPDKFPDQMTIKEWWEAFAYIEGGVSKSGKSPSR